MEGLLRSVQQLAGHLGPSTTGEAERQLRVTALGTKIIIDRNGSIVFRTSGNSGYDLLSIAIENAL